MPGRLSFFLIVFTISALLQLITLFTFRGFLKRIKVSKHLRNVLSIYPYILFNIPYLYVLFYRYDFSRLPHIIYNLFIVPFFIFQFTTFFIGLYLLIGKIIKSPFSLSLYILNRFRAMKERIAKFRSRKAVVTYDKSRRAFLTSSAMLVSGYAFIGAGLGVLNKDSYDISRIKMKIRNLPEALKGTSITVFSDIHSGPFMDANTMREYCDVINDLKSDIILIPGDLTNNLKSEAHPFADSFNGLKSKYGVYATLGNHDYFSDPDYIAGVINNDTDIKMLRNDYRIIEINGSKLCLMGVEDTRDSATRSNDIILQYLDETNSKVNDSLMKKADESPGMTKILMCHKPYMFEGISERKIDLTISGHTHGGQIVLAKFGELNLSLAATVSNYISGLYNRGDSKLYITRGIGTVGFPVRINCPPEITYIVLE